MNPDPERHDSEENGSAEEPIGLDIIPWTVAILAILFGTCMFGTGILSAVMLAMDETVGSPLYVATGVALSAGFMAVASCSYGITLIRRTRWKGDGEFNTFSGVMGWINAIVGLLFAAMMFIMFFGAFVILLWDRNFSDLLVLLASAGLLGPLFWLLGGRCWQGLQDLIAECRSRSASRP